MSIFADKKSIMTLFAIAKIKGNVVLPKLATPISG